MTNDIETPIAASVEAEIVRYESEVQRFRQGEASAEWFQRFRLQHGIYGQRQEGVQMVRVKIPAGALNAAQLDCLSDIADEFSRGYYHLTTRQDIQYHFVQLEDTPEIMRRLARVGLTTREACGNAVRNVTACHLAGVAKDEPFDVTPHTRAFSAFFLRNPVCQNMGRKFKVAFEGCARDHAVTKIHDIGPIARTREVNGHVERGFKLHVGGGLGATPMAAHVYSEFVPEEELIPLSYAILRVFDRLGERQRRMQARMKFLVKKLGFDEFKRLVEAERASFHDDPSWNEYLKHMPEPQPPADVAPLGKDEPQASGPEYDQWLKTNVEAQRQDGYSAVTIRLILGDLSSTQSRALAEILRRFTGGEDVRISIQQNWLLRWVPNELLPALYARLAEADLVLAYPDTIADVTCCPGADTCNLGITSSRGLSRELGDRLQKHVSNGNGSTALKDLRIKISGCPNSCGQHHIGDIGFHGSSVKKDGHVAPAYQLILGGTTNGGDVHIGKGVFKVPAKHIPAAVDSLLELYQQEQQGDEPFHEVMERCGKSRIKEHLGELIEAPSFEEHPEFYNDWSYDEAFFLRKDMVGECAGGTVEMVESGLADAKGFLEQARALQSHGMADDAKVKAYQAIVSATRGLLVPKGIDPFLDHECIELFENHFIRTGEVTGQSDYFAEEVRGLWEGESDNDNVEACLAVAKSLLNSCETAQSNVVAAFQQDSATASDAAAAAPAAASDTAELLDLKGVQCPINYVKAKLKLDTMSSGALLDILLDDGEPFQNVPTSLRNDGHAILDEQQEDAFWRIRVKHK